MVERCSDVVDYQIVYSNQSVCTEKSRIWLRALEQPDPSMPRPAGPEHASSGYPARVPLVKTPADDFGDTQTGQFLMARAACSPLPGSVVPLLPLVWEADPPARTIPRFLTETAPWVH